MVADNRVLIANDDEDKADIFGDYFTGVYTRELKEEFNELPPRGLTFPMWWHIFQWGGNTR